MIYIQKKNEPQWLVEFKRRYPKAIYDSEEFKGNKEKLRQELIEEQHGLCAYCCCRIDEKTSHNEHIEPRNPGTFVSKKSLDYDNIVASCSRIGTEKTCGAHKENKYDENSFISPLNKDCEEVFSYCLDGEMEGDIYTITLLNLNARRLKNERKVVLRMLQNMDVDEIKSVYLSDAEHPIPFINVVRWYVKDWESVQAGRG